MDTRFDPQNTRSTGNAQEELKSKVCVAHMSLTLLLTGTARHPGCPIARAPGPPCGQRRSWRMSAVY